MIPIVSSRVPNDTIPGLFLVAILTLFQKSSARLRNQGSGQGASNYLTPGTPSRSVIDSLIMLDLLDDNLDIPVLLGIIVCFQVLPEKEGKGLPETG